jgi:nucleotide-binding universal stress UspA family protein
MKTDKIKKVLIALDYDPTAQKVAEVGYSMAKAMNAEVILLHVMPDPVYYSSPGFDPIMGYTSGLDRGPLQTNTVETIKKATMDFLDKSKEHLGDKTIQTVVGDGDCADSILKTANDLHVDTIVMGSHSRKWLSNILMGSVTEKVLHHTSIPLYIVPTKKQN